MQYCCTLAAPEFQEDTVLPALSCEARDYEAFAALAERLAAEGVRTVNLLTADPLSFDQDRVIAILGRAHLSVAALCTETLYRLEGISMYAPNPYQRRRAVNRFNTLAGFAAQLGAFVRIDCGESLPGAPAAEERAWALESFRAAADYAGAVGVRLGLHVSAEKRPAFLGTVRELRAVCDAVAMPNFGYVLDLAEVFGQPAETWTGLAADCMQLCLTADGSMRQERALDLLCASGCDALLSDEREPAEDLEASMARIRTMLARSSQKGK